jgi:hypothetical protein
MQSQGMSQDLWGTGTLHLRAADHYTNLGLFRPETPVPKLPVPKLPKLLSPNSRNSPKLRPETPVPETFSPAPSVPSMPCVRRDWSDQDACCSQSTSPV